jgi:hypothetical protein
MALDVDITNLLLNYEFYNQFGLLLTAYFNET